VREAPIADGPKAEPVEATPPPSEAPTPPTTEAAKPPTMPDLADAPGATLLEEGAAAMMQEKWVEARKKLGKALDEMGTGASLDAAMAGHALVGRSCVNLKDARCAEKEFGVVLALWKDPRAFQKQMATEGDTGRARLARALMAAGEALFFEAEQKRLAANKETMPAYKGDGSNKDVQRFLQTKVGDFIKKKRSLIEEAENAYTKVLSLDVPPPRWVIASASRVGDMWGRFAAEFRAAPIPKEWRQKGTLPNSTMTYEELRAIYYEQLDQATAPLVERARSAYKTCARFADKFGQHDEYAARCETWLEKNAEMGQP